LLESPLQSKLGWVKLEEIRRFYDRYLIENNSVNAINCRLFIFLELWLKEHYYLFEGAGYG
jgi:hypothetical protein